MGGLRQVAQSLRRAGQRVIAVNHAGRGLHLLPALDTAPAPIAGDRPDVVVEGRDEACARRLPDNVAALRIVGTHDLVVMQKVDIRRRAGLLEQFEATRVERAALRPNQVARVMNRHLPLFHAGAHPGDVVAAAVTAGEHLAVAVERARDRRRQVFEFAGSNRFGQRLCCQVHGITSQKPHMGHPEWVVNCPCRSRGSPTQQGAPRSPTGAFPPRYPVVSPQARPRPARCSLPPRPGEGCRGCGRHRPRCPSTRRFCG